MAFHTESLRLLCVEDSKTTQLLYSAFLEDLVKEIIFANDGLQGLEIYKQGDIDIIFTDYEMPNMNGLEMVEKIRVQDQEIPIVLISAIDDINVITKSLQLSVNNFLKKPIMQDDVIAVLQSASKIFLANKILREEREKTLQELQDKDSYHSYQEDLTFQKELNILRNDFYYQMMEGQKISLLDFLYHPLDVVSGDAYSARYIDREKTFYLIVDGMGKGVSASLSAMLMTAFVNHLIDKMIQNNSFSLELLIEEAIEYIKPILLDEETLSVDFIITDCLQNRLLYAKFAMPPFLVQNHDDKVFKILSNNPPLSKWHGRFTIDSYDISEIDKFLFYSDGVVENSVKDPKKTYAHYILDDFRTSFSREELKEKIFSKITKQEDDLTMIFINKFDINNALLHSKLFSTSLESLEDAGEWYETLWKEFTDNELLQNEASIVFTELMMNAYEHGNLNIDADYKHKLLEDDSYFDELLNREKECSKKIVVKVFAIKNLSSRYIITQIRDEGNGFDTQILSNIFRNSYHFNGRGVFLSRKKSLGIYFNKKGNSVLYLNKI